MFSVGDEVVYPMHGAGVIESIEERAVLDEKQSYYIIKMPGEVKVMVPTAKAEEIGVRDIIDGESAQKVMKVLEKESTEMSMNWNKRYRENMKKMLLNAKQILVSELVLAEKKDLSEIEMAVDTKIDKAYEVHVNTIKETIEEGNVVKKLIPLN